MYIDKYRVEVFDRAWDNEKRAYKKTKEIVASIKDDTGICSKHFGRFLDDISENPTFRGDVTITVTIDRGDE
jgi:hypothetical protein